MSESLDGQIARIDELASQQQLQFVEQEGERQKRIADLEQQNTDRFNQFTKEQEEAAREFQDARREEGEEFIAELNLYKEQAEALLSAIGITGQTAAYGQFADRERKSAFLWNGVTIALLLGLIAVALLVILPQLGGAFAWNTFAGRAFTGLTIAIAASFTGRLGAKHQQREDYFRGMQLRLAALDPYLALLDDEQKKQIKVELAPELFEKPAFMKGKASKQGDLTKEAARFLLENAKPTD